MTRKEREIESELAKILNQEFIGVVAADDDVAVVVAAVVVGIVDNVAACASTALANLAIAGVVGGATSTSTPTARAYRAR